MKRIILSLIIGILAQFLSIQVFGQSDIYYSTLNEIQTSLGEGDAAKSYYLAAKLVEEAPDSSYAWITKSQIERQLMQYRRALESASVALRIDPGKPAYLYQISMIYSDLQQYDYCVAYCDSVIQKDSLNLLSSILKAQALYRKGDNQAALSQYISLQQLDTSKISFVKQLGSMCGRMDSLNDAISWYSLAIRIDSADIPSYTHLGNLYVKTEQYEQGLPVLSRGISIDSLNSWLFRFRGSLNIMGANFRDAEYDFHAAIRLGDSTAFTFRHYGLSLVKQSKYEEAFPVYQVCIKLDPEDSQAWYYLAYCYKWKEDLANAIKCMDKALALSVTPTISDVYSSLAQFHGLERDYDKAMHFYSRAYEWNDKDPVPLAQMGMLVEQMGGKKEHAKTYYSSFLEKAGPEEIHLKGYIENRMKIINEKLFMEGKLERN